MPRKLGQHFLRHSPSLKKITSALEIKNGDFIFEIGPGHGELSDFLISTGAETSFFLLEKDKKLVSFLKNKYANLKNIEIIYKSGTPRLRINGCQDLKIFASLSHAKDWALAFVILTI